MKENIHGSFGVRVKKDWKRNRSLYIMFIPVVLFYVLFMYKPMYGVIISFMDYAPAKGIWGSKWVGFKHFERFFTGPYFGRLLRNTLLLSLYSILFCFTTPIILALLLNEVHCKKYTAGIIKEFCMSDGLLNDIIVLLGGSRSALLQRPELYRTIYIVSDIWQEVGWGSIIYLAALAGIDQQLYEAAEIDGAGKWQQTLNVTIPGITPTIITMFILRVGNLMSMGYEKTILLYSSATYETADIISSYIYRVGLQEQSWSYSTAIGLLNSVINCILLVVTNKISKRVAATSLW